MVELSDVHSTYKKWLHVTTTNRIDAVLAVALTRQNNEKTRVWLILIGNSGDWKSVQISALKDFQTTRFLRSLTQKTLINGNPKVKDLAPQLDEKLVLIPEMASILKLDPKEKAQIWAQLRDLYDGIAGRDFGTGKSVDYTDIRVTLIMGSTPAIDSQILIHQDLGTRELVWRTSKNDKKDEKKVMGKCWDNEKLEKRMEEEINTVTIEFLRKRKYDKSIKVPDKIKEKLFSYASFLSKMRASASVDSYTGELLGDVNPEEPTRCLKQFKILYQALKSLDKDYDDITALEVIQHIVVSSSVQNRINIFKQLVLNVELSQTQIVNTLKIGSRTVKRELNILWNLGLVKKETKSYDNPNTGGQSYYDVWSIEENDLTSDLVKQFKDFIMGISEEDVE